MTALSWTAVAGGGALGAMARYGVSLLFSHSAHRGELPWATLIVNVLGTALLATLAALALSERGLSQTANLAIGTGFCGALTTFSTFSVETIALLRAGHATTALVYAGLSLGLCLAITVAAFVAFGTLPR